MKENMLVINKQIGNIIHSTETTKKRNQNYLSDQLNFHQHFLLHPYELGFLLGTVTHF